MLELPSMNNIKKSFISHKYTIEKKILSTLNEAFILRPLSSDFDFINCINLQRSVWGEADNGIIPATLLHLNQSISGVVGGAYDSKNNLCGFIYSSPGYVNKKLIHWSLRLAIANNMRDHNLGFHLKQYQKEWCLALGINTIYWTYDPLESRNAHFNLNKLGTSVIEYIENVYTQSQSLLHKGLPTDRLIVKWDLKKTTSSYQISKTQINAEILNNINHSKLPKCFKLEIPNNIQELKRENLNQAKYYQDILRYYINKALKNSYKIYFNHDKITSKSYYILENLNDKN